MRSLFSPLSSATARRTLSLLLVGLLPIALYAWKSDDGLRVFGAAVLVAGAASAAGALFGFLFGVPRVKTAEGQDAARYGPNTNLEQISDWLTKVLVGATLTQINEIPGLSGRLFGNLREAFGDAADSAAVGGAVVVSYSIIGFIGAWLLARLHLGRAMSSADARAMRLFEEASQAESAGDVAKATELRTRALAQVQLATDAAQEYERARAAAAAAER